MKQKKGNRGLLSLFPQHRVLDELSILSLYELVFYLLLLFGAWHLYKQWSRIPVLRQDIYVEKLDYRDTAKTDFGVRIDYNLPISSVYRKDSSAILVYSPMRGPKIHRPSLEGREVIKNLENSYANHLKDSTGVKDYGVLYIRTETPETRRARLNRDTTALVGQPEEGYYDLKRAVLRNKLVITDAWVPVDKSVVDRGISNEIKIGSSEILTLPGFWSKRDISQAYYEISVHTHTIDSVLFSVGFASAADISVMGHELSPAIHGNGIDYQLGFSAYRPVKTLRFHAQFKDLQNEQSRRVFLITAVLSGLIMVIIAFLVIFFYRLARALLESSRGRKGGKKDEEGESSQVGTRN